MSNQKQTEVELKFPLLNRKELVERLNSAAKPEKEEDTQKDTYYVPQHRNFLDKKPVTEWLRLRETKRGHSINYKSWHNKDGTTTVSCDEFEAKIENVEAIKKIFERLNFKKLITVEKKRSTWNFKNTEIAVDEVKELGTFIEIEAKDGFADTEDAKKHLYKTLKELGAKVGEQDFEGYPHRLLKQKGLLTNL